MNFIPGQILPVLLQLQLGETDKFVTATLRTSDGAEFADSPYSLEHVGEGLYSVDSVEMPITNFVTVQYKVFSNEALTSRDTTYPGVYTETFPIDKSRKSNANISGQVSGGEIKGVVVNE